MPVGLSSAGPRGKRMPNQERYTDYDRLAWFYDRYWGREYHQSVLPILEQLLLSLLPRDARLLDLCCGTGHLTRKLAELGYAVVGVDGSSEMLEFARKNVPGAEFFAEDARSFELPYKVQGVISTFESLNHVVSIDDLIRVFKHVLHALTDDGLMVFDMLMEEAYQTEWGKQSAIVEHDNVCIVRGGYDPNTRTGRTDLVLFRLEGTWRRSDLTIYQRCFSLGEIWAALEQAGFAEICSYDARRGLGMPGELAVGRAFFRAKKGYGS